MAVAGIDVVQRARLQLQAGDDEANRHRRSQAQRRPVTRTCKMSGVETHTLAAGFRPNSLLANPVATGNGMCMARD